LGTLRPLLRPGGRKTLAISLILIEFYR